MRELRPDGAFHRLTSCRHLVVAFETEAALWFDLARATGRSERLAAGTRVHFVYDTSAIEGDHAHAVEGDAFGFLSCLGAAVTRQLMLDIDTPDMIVGLESGLSAMRDLRGKGHGPATEQPTGFPAKRLASAIEAPAHLYSRAVFSGGLGREHASMEPLAAVRSSRAV